MRRSVPLALAVTVLLVTAACGGDDAPARGPDGSFSEPGEISVFDLREGDCFDDPSDQSTQVETVTVVPCSAPHDNEIYLEFELPDGPYPGAAGIEDAADARCFTAFEAFVGVDYFESHLEFFPVNPTEASWASGDRTVYCALYSLDLAKLTGSMRGSGR